MTAETKVIVERELVGVSHFGTLGHHVKYNVSKQTLIDDLKAELSALSVRVERVRRGEFKLYSGLSWPVSYGNTHNHKEFQLTGEMQLAPRTRQEYYLSKMAKTAGLVNQFVDDHGASIAEAIAEAKLEHEAAVKLRSDMAAEALRKLSKGGDPPPPTDQPVVATV